MVDYQGMSTTRDMTQHQEASEGKRETTIIDKMVRDFTTVIPKSKSEVRRRLLDLLAKERARLEQEIGGCCWEHKKKAREEGRAELKEHVQKALVDEINQAYREGTPTARLTSLWNVVQNF
jgi:hypothetical protein